MIAIIEIRRNNEYCMAGMLQGLDLQKFIIKKPTKAEKITEEQAAALDKATMNYLERMQNVKR